jgi:hypothetical protein
MFQVQDVQFKKLAEFILCREAERVGISREVALVKELVVWRCRNIVIITVIILIVVVDVLLSVV